MAVIVKSIVFVTSYPLKKEPVIHNRLMPFLNEACGRGYSVSLISPDDAEISLEGHENFHHIAIGSRHSSGSGFIRRAIREAILARRILKYLERTCCADVVITIPSMFLLFLCPSRRGRRAYLDIRDLTWEYLSDRIFIQKCAKRLFRYLAYVCVRKFSCVMVTNQTEYKYARKVLKISDGKLLMVPNGISKNQFTKLTKVTQKPIDKSDIVVSYIGNVGEAQNLPLLLIAAQRLPSITFNIVGGGNDLDRVKKIKDEMCIPNVNIHGRISWESVPQIYSSTDILYAQLSKNFSYAMPSKIYEYLATGKFVIYGGTGQALEMLSDFDNNVVIDPDNIEALVGALECIVASGKFSSISTNNIMLVRERYIREVNVDALFRRINTLEVASQI